MATPLPFLLIDAFENGPFTGNPAGVCLLDEDKDDAWMQGVAAEINQAETAFLFSGGEGYSLRWFTPTIEVDLCGHATLAAAHALWTTSKLPWHQPAIFHTKSGRLTAEWLNGKISLDFPAEPAQATNADGSALGVPVIWGGQNRMDYLFEVESEAILRQCKPNMEALVKLGMRGIIVTARGNDDYDFVSRFFAPNAGVDEDPVTGSAHCALGPYWAAKLGKETLTGYQASTRGGTVGIKVRGERVSLLGTARTVVEGSLLV